MAQDSSSAGSGSNETQARSNASRSRGRRSLTRIRRDASAEVEEVSASEYSGQSGGDSSDDQDSQSGNPNKVAREEADELDQPRSKRTKYTTLETATNTVKGQVIRDNWRPTTVVAQMKVRTLLSLVERPVMNSYRDLERRKEAQASLVALNRMFEERLPLIRFPITTKEWHFDYEAILRNNRDLEQQLAAAKHGGGLLQAEITKERQLLADAKGDLKELEQNANAEQKARMQRDRGTLQLWTESSQARPDGSIQIGLQDLSQSVNAAIKSEDMFSFMPELEHHLSNIEDNLDQLKGLPNVIDSASTTLALYTRRSG